MTTPHRSGFGACPLLSVRGVRDLGPGGRRMDRLEDMNEETRMSLRAIATTPGTRRGAIDGRAKRIAGRRGFPPLAMERMESTDSNIDDGSGRNKRSLTVTLWLHPAKK